MLHTATLFHDDLVDGAPLRRGRQTLHTVWPVGAAVLAGDYLLGQATKLVAELGHPHILGTFGEILCTICAGEIRQVLSSGETERTREAYYRHIEAKTASLFAALADMAATLAEAPPSHIVRWAGFGRELGLAFADRR